MQQQSLNNIIFGTTENLHAHCVTPEFFLYYLSLPKKEKKKKTKLMRDLVSFSYHMLLLLLVLVVVLVVVGSDIRSTHPPSVFNIFGVCIILFIQTETQKKEILFFFIFLS
jgi:hypothetical protein